MASEVLKVIKENLELAEEKLIEMAEMIQFMDGVGLSTVAHKANLAKLKAQSEKWKKQLQASGV